MNITLEALVAEFGEELQVIVVVGLAGVEKLLEVVHIEQIVVAAVLVVSLGCRAIKLRHTHSVYKSPLVGEPSPS